MLLNMKSFGSFSETAAIPTSGVYWTKKLGPISPRTLMLSGGQMQMRLTSASTRKGTVGKHSRSPWGRINVADAGLRHERLALRVLSLLFTISGKSAELEKFANAPTLEEQRRLYEKSIRPVLVSGSFVKLVLSNPIFLWNSLGVPMNQLAVLAKETSEATSGKTVASFLR